MKMNRRALLSAAGSGLVLSYCSGAAAALAVETPSDKEEKQPEVTAVEDLMREHGVLRRVLFVYSECAVRLRTIPGAISLGALAGAAGLFRGFGEDYHEKKLEEAYIFPAVAKAGGPAAVYPDILIAQHERGRQITDYIISVTQLTSLDPSGAEQLAGDLDAMVRMYRPHAAREDTVVFPAWKKILMPEQMNEMNEKFEDIEHEMFGEDGFEKAVRQISEIETELGIADLSQFTAPPIS
jgi:hemerythrin-like domain-containing protein